jgi:hypothetical protein
VVSKSSYDADDELLNNIIAKVSIPNTGQTIDMDANEISGVNQVGDEISMTVFSAKLATINVSANSQAESDNTNIANRGWSNDTTVKLSASATQVASTSMTFYFELISASSTATTTVTRPSNACASTTAYTDCSSKVWQVTKRTILSAASSTLSVTGIPESAIGYKWQVIAWDGEGTHSVWRKFNTLLPNFYLDAAPPSAPGPLLSDNVGSNSVTLRFGSSSVDNYFKEYKIFYKLGTSGVSETDTEHSDADLAYIDYNGTATTTISGLAIDTSYTINIWAYDDSGQKASSTKLVIRTNKAISADAFKQYKADLFTSVLNQGWTDEAQINLSALANSVGGATTSAYYYYFELLDESGSYSAATSAPAGACVSGTSYAACGTKVWKTAASTTPWYDTDWGYRKKIIINALLLMADIWPLQAAATFS